MNQDYEWFSKTDMSGYIGKWIVILNKEIVGSGKNPKPIIDKIKKENPKAIPFVVKVTEENFLVI